ncbi:MAG TPA: alpha/beta hydrolase-fold protein [Saprospiraceae bacterium]|nr:alpha/beta hydrolase [Saprospiraceae bacterium]HRO09485.1 alpha/beta hydrolase-fold protein [Saprospiraceae bacterium]HRP42763.1 alpha/beta hydrolase-fold protein [Saprospiraceae bacterium]
MTDQLTKSYQPIIEILDSGFEIPQLGRKRRIAVLLPYDYYESDKKYPVLYLHDGQNLFDEYAPYGNWGIDKSLVSLSEEGIFNAIIVAIDHGGELRIQEYLPYSTPRYTQAEGDLYIRFMLEDLKPMIEEKYRVLGDRASTGIGGSSLGGLISLYAGFQHPDKFGKMMIFSPSLWISEAIYTLAKTFTPGGPTDIYLYAGGMESANHYGQVMRLDNILQEKRKYDGFDVIFAHNPSGRHSEINWGQQFPIAFKWLFYSKY